MQDQGGWTNRDTAEHFATYASAMYARLGDRVGTWTTLNEPWCSAYLGYGNGVHAPGVQDPGAAFSAVHHLLLAHGLAVQALRAGGAGRVGVTLNPADVRPADPNSAADAAAARLVDGLHNRIFLDPLLVGGYPDDVREHVARIVEPTFVEDGDEKIIAAPIDLLGINYYAPTYVAGRPDGAGGGGAYPGTEGAVQFLAPVGPLTDMGWMIEPAGLTRLLERIATDYPAVPLLITENGAAFPDKTADPTTPCRTRTGSPTSTATCAPRTRPSPGASTCAAISYGHCLTTSSGPRGTVSDSASCTSTTSLSGVHRSPAPGGTRR
ncbi:hypothetical protein GCM10029963_54800 [Micromonospora andamanensis]